MSKSISDRLDICFRDLKSLSFSKRDGMSCYGYVVNVKLYHLPGYEILDQWVEDGKITPAQKELVADELANGVYYYSWLNAKQEGALKLVRFPDADKETIAAINEFIDPNSYGFYGRSGGWFGFWLNGGADIEAWAENIKTMIYNDADIKTEDWELCYVERAIKAAAWITKTIEEYKKNLNFEQDLLADIKKMSEYEKELL